MSPGLLSWHLCGNRCDAAQNDTYKTKENTGVETRTRSSTQQGKRSEITSGTRNAVRQLGNSI